MDQKVLKKSESENNGINPVVAAVTGAIVGGLAVTGAAIAVVLSDKKNSDKVHDYASNLKEVATEEKDKIAKKLAESEQKIKHAAIPENH